MQQYRIFKDFSSRFNHHFIGKFEHRTARMTTSMYSKYGMYCTYAAVYATVRVVIVCCMLEFINGILFEWDETVFKIFIVHFINIPLKFH